jgi:hypothetical protein
MWPYLLPVFFILNGIHCTARFGIEHEVKASIFTKATSIAEEGILFIIVDGSEEPKCLSQWGIRDLGRADNQAETMPHLYSGNDHRNY